MKFSLFIGFLILFIANAAAQQNHYIYIQTENRQAFYVKTNDKVYSSSSSGYLIVSKLPDGEYDLLVGFPKAEWPEQHYSVKLANKDQGYMLKNFDTKGWGLFNLETMEVVMNTSPAAKPETKKEVQNDAFSNTLANVVSTPSIKQKEEVKKEEVKKEEKLKATPVASKANKSIEKIFSTFDNEGQTMMYVINDEYRSDTVRITIPIKGEVIVVDTMPVQKKTVKKQVPVLTKAVPAKTSDNDKQPVDTAIVIPVKAPVSANTSAVNCKANASQADFIKLRKEMAAQDGDDEMVAVARKVFRSKCFSTEQVKNLSVLFLKDDGKYQFFDAAYMHTSDPDHFNSLEGQLTDAYYINRFRAMIRQ